MYSSDYSKVEYNGYGYQQTDLGHPGYGGYSTAGPFPLTSPLSRPRSSKAKSQSGEFLPKNLFVNRSKNWCFTLWKDCCGLCSELNNQAGNDSRPLL